MAHIVDRLRPVSQDLGCKAELEGLLEILDPAPAPSCSGPCTRGTVPSPTWSGTFWKPRRPSNLPTRTSRAPPCAPAGPVRVRPIPPVAGVVSKIGRLRIASLGASYPERLPKRGNRGGASYGERWIRGGFRGRRSGPGEGPQTLAQLQSTGAVVVGSDGEKVGDLKTVGDADFVVGRTLRQDLHVPVKHVREVTADNKIVLDVSADEAKKARWDSPSTDTSGGAEGFSASARVEKGGLELGEENTQETK